ncbi:uncharacterized protein TNCV_3129131 [Trichonephila clavipes]|nr:uncharacterized protein TNCV_3129131 [Trichonephila clavipes]
MSSKQYNLHYNILQHQLSFLAPWGCGSPVVKVSDHDRHVISSSPVPLKTHREGEWCTLNLSRAQSSSRWCGVEVKRRRCLFRCRTCHNSGSKL